MMSNRRIVSEQRTESNRDLGRRLAYITKQKLPFSPEVEATHWHRRQPSERVVGVRLSFSMDAKALIASQRSKEQPAVVAALLQDRPWGIALYEKDQERRQRRRSSNRSARLELAKSA